MLDWNFESDLLMESLHGAAWCLMFGFSNCSPLCIKSLVKLLLVQESSLRGVVLSPCMQDASTTTTTTTIDKIHILSCRS